MRRVSEIKTKLIILFAIVFAFFFYSITISAAEYLERLRITSVEVLELNIDGTYQFLRVYESSDDSIFEIDNLTGRAKSEGSVYLTLPGKKEKKYIVTISAYYDHITIEGDLMIDKDETTELKATVSPELIFKLIFSRIHSSASGYLNETFLSSITPFKFVVS